MKIARLNSSFSKHTDSALESKAQSIHLSMKDNPNFTTPTPSLADLLTAITAFSDAVAAALDGGRIKIAERTSSRKTLETLLRQLAAYVTMIAKGDETILISSGFDLRKDAEKRPPVSAPQAIEVTSGNNPGEVRVTASGVKDAKTYLHEYTTDPLTADSVWVQALDTHRKYTFSGLQPGKKYWFRVGVIGLRGAKVYSSEVSYMVQ